MLSPIDGNLIFVFFLILLIWQTRAQIAYSFIQIVEVLLLGSYLHDFTVFRYNITVELQLDKLKLKINMRGCTKGQVRIED